MSMDDAPTKTNEAVPTGLMDDVPTENIVPSVQVPQSRDSMKEVSANYDEVLRSPADMAAATQPSMKTVQMGQPVATPEPSTKPMPEGDSGKDLMRIPKVTLNPENQVMQENSQPGSDAKPAEKKGGFFARLFGGGQK